MSNTNNLAKTKDIKLLLIKSHDASATSGELRDSKVNSSNRERGAAIGEHIAQERVTEKSINYSNQKRGVKLH